MVEEPSQRGPGLLIEFGHAAGRSEPGQFPWAAPAVNFDRLELMAILNVYGRKVSAGEWHDYAMDFLRERALFSIYRGNSERPLFVIEKIPRLRHRQGQYMVTNQEGRVLRRGHDLVAVLRVLDSQLALVK